MKSNIFISGKKGSLLDPILSGAYILKISATILIGIFIWLSFQAVMNSLIVNSNAYPVLNNVMTSLTSAYYSMDYVFPFLVGGLLLISTIFAYKTGTNIVWGILSIIIWLIAILFSVVLTNVYISISAEFPTIYANMPIMDTIMLNMRWLVFAWIAVISAVMFRKNNVEDEASETQRRFYGR